MTPQRLQAALPKGLMLMGHLVEDGQSLVLLGADAAFWAALQDAPEFAAPDPVDLWSLRVVGDLAQALGAEPLFPFGGPPYQPFIRWAFDTGRAWPSPTGMLVHDLAGLMISYRGALRFDHDLGWAPDTGASPCDSCAEKPCITACPVSALSGTAPYDVPSCHAFLDTEDGADCMGRGCKVRRACPISQGFGRSDAQSAHHMRSFHP
ncbi:MAG: ferredoxin [Rhodobacteraceae bacterium]|nr:ferredoxin [Paracoccaceae bacterium]